MSFLRRSALAAFILIVSKTVALEFAFTELSCSRVAYTYKLASGWESTANALLINFKDETVAAIEINSPSGMGSFDPTVITEAATYTFTVALSSDKCNLLASDGTCYQDGKNQLYALAVSQPATCSANGGQGTNDADATLPSINQAASQTAADSSAATTGLVGDAALSTAAAVTVSHTVAPTPAAATAPYSAASGSGSASSPKTSVDSGSGSSTAAQTATILAQSYPKPTSQTSVASGRTFGLLNGVAIVALTSLTSFLVL